MYTIKTASPVTLFSGSAGLRTLAIFNRPVPTGALIDHLASQPDVVVSARGGPVFVR
jgi:hypothetical protein